ASTRRSAAPGTRTATAAGRGTCGPRSATSRPWRPAARPRRPASASTPRPGGWRRCSWPSAPGRVSRRRRSRWGSSTGWARRPGPAERPAWGAGAFVDVAGRVQDFAAMPFHASVPEWDADLVAGDPLGFPGYAGRRAARGEGGEAVATGRTEHYAYVDLRFDV